jgi:hypothetical protein
MDNEPQAPDSERISSKKLERLSGELPPRERGILEALHERRYLTTGQIAALLFDEFATPATGLRIATQHLQRLKAAGLTATLDRRIGGARAGSSSFVWALTPNGFRLLHLDSGGHPRKRHFEPSPRFLEHTLSIAELSLQLRDIDGITLSKIEFEAACWRNYPGPGGARLVLKPDLFAITSDGDYEDSWFFEVDLDTESPNTVVAKCQQYETYYLSNAEQRQRGVFPLVVWIVPSEKRRGSLVKHINDNFRHKELFKVIVPEELTSLIRKGASI